MKCPKCNGKLLLKDEATYIYSYQIEEASEKTTSYLFCNREQKNFKQYIQCENCSEIYPYSPMNDKKIDYTILQKAVRSNIETTPPYFK